MKKKILRTICLLTGFAMVLVCFNQKKSDMLRAAVYSNQTDLTNNTEGFLIGDIEVYHPSKEYNIGDVVQSKGELFVCKEACIGTDISDENIWEKTSVFGLVKNLTTNFENLSTTMNHIDATAGGGCYYTCFTTKPYLNGYKLRLTDHITAKSCTVLFDEESNYYAGTATIPLNNEIEIELWYNGKLQGTMITNCATTSGFATINLDELIDANFLKLLNINDHLATNMCRDSHFTNNRELFPEILSLVYQNNCMLGECLSSINGLSAEFETFEMLYEQPETLIQILNHDFADLFLDNENIANDIANNRTLLYEISKDSTSIERIEDSAKMHQALYQSTLSKSQTMTGGEAQEVTGNLIVISIESGTLGNSYEYGTRLNTGNHGTATMYDCKGYISQRPNCFYTINDLENKVITESVQTGYGATYTFGSSCHHVGANESGASANLTITPCKFVQAVRVEAMTPRTLTEVNGDWNNTDTRTASYPTAPSNITYIDLEDTQ